MNFEETKNNHASFNVNNVTRHGLSGEKGGLREDCKAVSDLRPLTRHLSKVLQPV